MKVLLIIPAYNEGEGIVSLIAKIKQARPDIDYVVINDGSKDNTDELLKAHNINHVTLVKNLGIGGAVQTGYRYAKDNEYDIAIQFDGDGQHDIDSVQTLIDAIVSKEGNLVIGSRFVSDSSSEFQSSFMRRVGITILSMLIKITTGKRILDVTSGNRACNRDIIEYFADEYPTEYPEPESIVHVIKRGYTVKEVGVTMFEREFGVSSIRALNSVKYMIKVGLSIIIASMAR